MDTILDLETLLRGTPPKIAKYLRVTLEKYGEGAVTSAILEAVENEVISSAVFPLWLSIVRQPASLSAILTQNFSRSGRHAAIKWIGKWMTKNVESWHAVWAELGFAAGLVKLLATLSISDVKFFLKVMGDSYTVSDDSKQVALTELFRMLCSIDTADVCAHNPDQRPLLPFYLNLLPACSEECVREMTDSHSELIARWTNSDKLLKSHTELMRTLYRQSYGTKLSFLHKLCVDSPDCLGHDRDFTAPMSFVWLLAREVPTIENEKEHSNRLRWLLHKAICRHMAIEKILPIAQRTLEAFENSKGRSFAIGEPNFLHDITRCWGISARDNTDTESWTILLSRALELTKPKVLPMDINVDRPLLMVERAHRYQLLRLYASHHRGIDIENNEHLHHLKFHSTLFGLLEPKSAVSLLDRLIKVRPACDFILFVGAPSLLGADPSFESVYPLMLLANIMGDYDRSAAIVSEKIEAQKMKAERSRDQIPRLLITKTVIWWATWSKSLKILKEVFIWLRRFTRDPLTVRTIYGNSLVASSGNMHILAALPLCTRTGSTEIDQDKIQSDVALANQIIRDLLETMDTAMREPSYVRSDWFCVRQLFSCVVGYRMLLAERLEKGRHLSPEKIYDCVWKNTLELYGSIAQKPQWSQDGQKKPELNVYLVPDQVYQCKPIRSRASLRFLDAVARVSNDTWERYRTLEQPTTAILTAPFPKGLPLKYLLSGGGESCGWNHQTTPFVASKAKAIALMDADIALRPVPFGKDITSAISVYVEDFQGAVEIYVNDDQTVQGRTQRLLQVWNHWLSVFGKEGSMSVQDAALYLRSALSPLVRDDALKQIFDSFEPLPPIYDYYPKLPGVDIRSGVQEWNPAEMEPTSQESSFKPKAIDCFIPGNPVQASPESDFSSPTHRGVSRGIPPFWRLSRLVTNKADANGTIAEGMITCAILCLDSKIAGVDRLLAEPWPNNGTRRYPALYLDAAFLDRHNGQSSDYPLCTLSRYLKRVSPSLLLKLTEKYLQKFSAMPVDSPMLADIESTAFGLLKLLSKSENPQLACNLVIVSVLDNPDSSSWHRQLLGPGLLAQLSAHRAKGFVGDFASEINVRWQKLNQNQQPEATKSDKKSNTKSAPRVKITTVKLLAELIRGAHFISIDFSISILANLFERASHIDIKIATLDALMEFLPKGSSEAGEGIVEQVIQIIETAVPTVSRFNEREELSEKEWDQALASRSPPLPNSENISLPPPLANKLIIQISMPDKYKQKYFAQVVEPALALSLRNKKRWLKIVLEKYGGDDTLIDLAMPFTPHMVDGMITKYQEHMAMDDLARLINIRRSVLQPSPSLQKLIDKLKSTAENKNSPEGRCLLSEFDQSSAFQSGLSWPICHPAALLRRQHRGTKRTDGQGITVAELQRLFIQEALWLLEVETNPELLNFSSLLDLIGPHSTTHDIHSNTEDRVLASKAWLANARPALVELANIIESKRTPEWQRDRHRSPRFLPSRVWMGLYLLPFPFLNDSSSSNDERCKSFETSLLAHVAEVPPALTSPLFMPFSKVIKLINWCSCEDTIRIACHLGTEIDSLETANLSLILGGNTATMFFGIHLAKEIFTLSKQASIIKGEGILREKVREVLKGWAISPVEELRMLGLRTLVTFGFNLEDLSENSIH